MVEGKQLIERKGYIDCARGICVLYIVGFWHMFDYIGIYAKNYVTNCLTVGILATFTFISGYFSGGKKIKDYRTTILFYQKRWISFYPMYVVACMLLWRIGYIEDLRQFLLTIIGLACFIPPFPATVWYMCMLMIFYFVTPFINRYSIRGGGKAPMDVFNLGCTDGVKKIIGGR